MRRIYNTLFIQVLPMLVLASILSVSVRADLDDLDDLDLDESEVYPIAPAEKGRQKPKPDVNPPLVSPQDSPPSAQPEKNDAPSAKAKDSRNSEQVAPSVEVQSSGTHRIRTSPEDPEGKNEPVRFKSRDLKAQKETGIAELKSDVVITQAATELKSDYAKIYSDPLTNNVTKAEAQGNVRLKRDAIDPADRLSAKSDKATFYYTERKIILQGNASLTKEGSVLKGKKITYDMETGWITFDSAEGIMQPGEAKR
jgi:lipopolysaccharide transport protein LptA